MEVISIHSQLTKTLLTAVAARGVSPVSRAVDRDRGEVTVARNEGGDGEEREEDGVHGGTKITTRVGFEERTRECASSQKRATKSVSDV